MIQIRAINQEDDYLSFQIYGLDTVGTVRLSIIETTISEYPTPQDWLDANQVEAQALVDAGRYVEEFAATVDWRLLAAATPLEYRQLIAFDLLDDWRTTQRTTAGLTEPAYLDARRTIATGQPAEDIPQAEATVATWEEIERQYNQSVNLIRLAKSIEDTELILARRYNG